MSSVLDGINVLELCEVFQGPLAGQILADFGADVLKIEKPGKGDSLRHSDTVANAQGKMGSYFGAVNRNKRSVCLDLKNNDDRHIFTQLVQKADVLMHNYRPGVLDRLGFGYQDVAKLNPRIIFAAASGFGETGPLSGMAGQDFLIQSMSGIAWKTTADNGGPTFINVPLADYTSGLLLAQGILLALFERQQSGRGQQVNVSLLSALMSMQSLEAATTLNYGYDTQWYERALNFTAQASDGWLSVIGFFRDNPLKLVCQGLGIEDLSLVKGWEDKHAQAACKTQIAERLRPYFLTMTVEESVNKLQAAGVLAAPILDFNQALAHPQIESNGLITTVPVEGQEAMRFLGSPVKLSRTPATVRRGPPALDAHKDDVRHNV